MRFASRYILDRVNVIEEGKAGTISSKGLAELKDIAATSAGLKSLCT